LILYPAAARNGGAAFGGSRNAAIAPIPVLANSGADKIKVD
jgi:hypothetical protein